MMKRMAGFTLIELLVTVMIVSILAVGALPMMQITSLRAKESELRASLRQLRVAIDAYKKAADEGRIRKTIDQSGYPPSLAVLAEGVPDEKDPNRKKMRFLRSIPRDPMAGQPDQTAEETWGKRSYESEHDNPAEGADVYDVYSLSPRKGLNGLPYGTW